MPDGRARSAVVSVGYLAFLNSRLRGADDEEAKRAMRCDYQHRRVPCLPLWARIGACTAAIPRVMASPLGPAGRS